MSLRGGGHLFRRCIDSTVFRGIQKQLTEFFPAVIAVRFRAEYDSHLRHLDFGISDEEKHSMNKEIVGKWFDAIWGESYDPAIIGELADPGMVMQYPLHGRNEGPEAIRKMLDRLRTAFPDLRFWIVGDVIAEGDYVFGRWEGGGTHTGPAFSDLPAGSLPENSGKAIHFTGMSIFKVVGGKILEEIGEEDALRAATQLGVVTTT